MRTRTGRSGGLRRSAALIVALTALVILLPISVASLTWSSRQPGPGVLLLLALGFAALHGSSFLSVSRPLPGFVLASALMLALLLIPAAREASAAMHPSALVYLLCLAQVSARERLRISVPALVVAVLGAGLIALAEPAFGADTAIDQGLLRLGAFGGLAASATAAWACGLLVRSAAARGEERTRVRVEQAIADERMRISGELHDVVAHAMTVMIAQSEVARALVREQPDDSERALGVVIGTGRDALRGMRAIVTAEGEATTEPIPTPDALPDLVAAVRSPACQADFRETGERRALTAPAMLALHHAIREALTNAVRHTQPPPVRIAVQVAWSPASVVAEVSDDGGAGHSGSDLGTGTGLVGLAERIRLAGGTLRSGRDGSRGWRVRVALPVLSESSSGASAAGAGAGGAGAAGAGAGGAAAAGGDVTEEER